MQHSDVIDLHSHLLPFVDDGAEDWGQARAALEALSSAGVRTATVTPHVRGSLTLEPGALDGRLSELDSVWPEFLDLAGATAPGMRVLRAAELMLDRPDVDLSDPRIRLNGTRFVLVELPHMSVPPGSIETLHDLVRRGWTPLLAHPERYRGVAEPVELAAKWRRAGALLQVNAGSMLGAYGDTARRTALLLLREGLVDVVASDYHTRGPFPSPAARDFLSEEFGAPADLVATLFESNPARLLEGRDPEPVAALPRRLPIWRRILS